MRARTDRTAAIVEQAVKAVRGGAPATAGGAGTAQAGSGGVSLQDGSGQDRWIWGVSVWTDQPGGDVFADE